MRVLISFTLLMLWSCSGSPDCNIILKDLRRNFEAGNLKTAKLLSDSLNKVCPAESSLINEGDSLAEIANRILLDFSVSEEKLFSQLEKNLPAPSKEEISKWEDKGWLESRMIDGEKMYFHRTASNLLLLKKFHEQKEEWLHENENDPELVLRLNHTKNIIENSGNGEPAEPVNMKITYTVTVHPDAVPAGEKIRCWLPWPKEAFPRQKNIKLLHSSETQYIIAPDTAIHSSIYMEGTSQEGKPSTFSVTFLYQSNGQHFKKIRVLPYNKMSEEYRKYTSEQLPQICFTDNIKHLADSIASDKDSPDEVVRKIYYWFKDNIPWAGALEYSIMPNIPEYVCHNMRGDCGMQTFLFMSMLRYKGIPVRWQSGWMVPPIGKNLHDWCEVFYEGTGWVPADVSYNLQSSEDEVVKNFYLSGIDSYRMIVNQGFGGRLHPEKNYMRSEPYDFQRGEVEWKGGNLYFDKWDYKMDIEYLNTDGTSKI